ncbi:MAG: hypothetical protein IJW72_00460 [Alphaproteobacteria bacterium]|nr:hypothetical protein [Alphaproteobacteria bacterium]MBQ7284714.1 hypothetical protein [Alphaproteobacteria bacterium]
MSIQLEQATADIKMYRTEIIDKLMKYTATDMLLFWGTDRELIAEQQKYWEPLLKWAEKEFDGNFKKTHGLDVSEENLQSGYRLKAFLERLSDRELAAYYLAALNMRSVLLAAALVKKQITAEQAYGAAYLEQLFQEKKWGKDEDAAAKLAERKKELYEIEDFLKQ